MGDNAILQFAPFSSAVDTGFWHKFTNLKLDVLHLSEEPIPITGSYVNSDAPGLKSRLSVEYDALEREKEVPRLSFKAVGTLINTNTMEEFRNRDKVELLKSAAASMWEAMTSGLALDDPSLLASCLMFTFADLKKYHYYYWFAFPAFTLPKTIPLVKQPQPISSHLTEIQIENLLGAYNSQDSNSGFFTVKKDGDNFSIHPLNQYAVMRGSASNTNQEIYLGFCDPCTLPLNPGWPLRNLLTLAALKWSKEWPLHKILCLRIRTSNGVQDASHSIAVEVDLGGSLDSDTVPSMPQCLGWEKNERGKMGPRMVNLSSTMDPTRLAASAVDLNLKLMRWRIVPELNLPIIQNTRCLLLGAGTLGCGVARCLLGWGVHNITLVDSAKVSFSNPVRQNLFVFESCLNGGQSKATAAAKALMDIFPKVNAKGVVMNIPMPGHTVGESLVEQVRKDVEAIEQLIDEHDAIFLLMDSRESRWLPSMLGSLKNKLVFTAALGFDSFLVMRHGVKQQPGYDTTQEGASCSQGGITSAPIPGHQLGCYFCNDVVAPGDSTRDRTLDQQCTVSRPGVSYLAAAYVTELLVSLLQHPDGGFAEASVSSQQEGKEGVLGAVPHSVRGFLGRHQQLTPATASFDKCSACSDKVLSAYKEDGFSFLLKVFNTPSYLEEITGLSKLQQCTDDSQIWELSDSEEEME